MRARELTYRSKRTKEGGEVGSGDGVLLIAKGGKCSGPSEGFKVGDYAPQGLAIHIQTKWALSKPGPSSTTCNFTSRTLIQLRIVKMLIQETHQDVPTKADEKEGSMSR